MMHRLIFALVINGVATADDPVLEVGATVAGNNQSHYLERGIRNAGGARLENNK